MDAASFMIMLLLNVHNFVSFFRLYDEQIDEVRKLNSKLGVGIGIFQGLTNLALNGNIIVFFKSESLV